MKPDKKDNQRCKYSQGCEDIIRCSTCKQQICYMDSQKRCRTDGYYRFPEENICLDCQPQRRW